MLQRASLGSIEPSGSTLAVRLPKASLRVLLSIMRTLGQLQSVSTAHAVNSVKLRRTSTHIIAATTTETILQTFKSDRPGPVATERKLVRNQLPQAELSRYAKASTLAEIGGVSRC